MDSGGIIKVALIAVGGYLLYEWLNSSGLLAQFGIGNSFTTSASLLQYCQANPTGSATYNGYTLPCSQWLTAATPAPAPVTANPISTTPVTSAPSPAPMSSAVSSFSAAQLLAAAGTSNPNQTYTVDQWNFLLQKMSPSEQVSDLSNVGIVRGVNDTMTAAQYIANRSKAGLSGLGFLGAFNDNPYSWRM